MRIVMFFLKCIVGILATLGLLMVGGAFAVWLFIDQVEPLRARVKPLPDAMVLTFDLGRGLIEVQPENPLSRASLGPVIVLRHALDALEAAAADDRVKGIFVRLGRGTPGLALAQELRDAVLEFRASGKFAIAFAETFGEAGNGTQHYYLASAFDRIWLQPSGDVGLTGFSIESPFLRSVFDDLGIEPRFGQRGAYKGAVAFLTDSRLPEPQRLNLQRLLDSSLERVVRDIAAARKLDPADVSQLIDTGPHGAVTALEHKLIDQLGYWSDAEADAMTAAGIGDAEADDPFVTLGNYNRRRDMPEPEGETFALIHGLGPVVLDTGGNDPVFGQVTMGADTVAAALRTAMDTPEVRAIVFRVDSPGGSYVASDVIWHEMRRAKERGLPVIVTMGGVAASGGYFVAAPAHAIVAQPGTITGSIGVVTGKVVASGLWDRLGVTWDGVKAGARADAWSPNRDFTEAEWTSVQESLNRVYADFTQKVAEGRGMPIARVTEVAEGRVWSGADALDAGLVDALGGYRKAFALAREAAGLDPEAPIQVRVFPEARDPVQAFIEDAFGDTIEVPGMGAFARGLATIVQAAGAVTEVLSVFKPAQRGMELRAHGTEELR
jgi:protease-4